jgi:KEOPS complex subunit Cgi121
MEVSVIGAVGKLGNIAKSIEQVKEYEASHDINVQLFRADRVFGKLHIVRAVEHATRAFSQGRNLADDVGMEILLYAAAERQIGKAITKMGVAEGTGSIALVIIGQAPESKLLSLLGLSRCDSVLAPEGKDHKLFGICDEEMGLVGPSRTTELVLEKMALSELIR